MQKGLITAEMNAPVYTGTILFGRRGLRLNCSREPLLRGRTPARRFRLGDVRRAPPGESSFSNPVDSRLRVGVSLRRSLNVGDPDRIGKSNRTTEFLADGRGDERGSRVPIKKGDGAIYTSRRVFSEGKGKTSSTYEKDRLKCFYVVSALYSDR